MNNNESRTSTCCENIGENMSELISAVSSLPDAIYAFIFEAGQTASAEVVCGTSRQAEEENHSRAHHHHPREKAQDVLVPRVERLQDCLQKVCLECLQVSIVRLSKSFCRYASLYFCCAVEQDDNELLTLEIIHRYVELLDKYFGSVSLQDIPLMSHDDNESISRCASSTSSSTSRKPISSSTSCWSAARSRRRPRRMSSRRLQHRMFCKVVKQKIWKFSQVFLQKGTERENSTFYRVCP